MSHATQKFLKLICGTFLILALLLLSSCAKIVPLSGGEIDRQPPSLIKVIPNDKQVNFNYKTITFYFDEFFTLKNPTQNIFLSPLTDSELNIISKGKKLIVELPDKLESNITYKLIFKNAIADLNEGNALPYLEYTFTTGNKIDSLSIEGKILDAKTNAKMPDVNVMLFKDGSDSILLKRQFAYYTITNQNGEFKFSNVADGIYRLYAIKEKDNNLLYSSPDELIGFYDTVITVKPYLSDDLKISNNIILTEPIRIFQQPDTTLKLIKHNFARKGLYQLIFNLPVKEISVGAETPNDTIFLTKSTHSDTIFLWFAPSIQKTTTKIYLTINNKPFDTLTVNLKRTSRASSQEEKYQPLQIKTENFINDSLFLMQDTIFFTTNNIVKTIIRNEILLIDLNDTIRIPIHQHSNPHKIYITPKLLENKKYTLIFPDSSMVDFFNQKNSELKKTFRVVGKKYLGNLIISIKENVSDCHILVLQNKQGKKIEKKFTQKQETYLFENLLPEEYSLKLIFDKNCNGKWDNGDLYRNIQPEAIEVLNQSISIKSNWTGNYTWQLKK